MAKVALLLPNLAGGGAERVFIDLARGLAATFDIDLVVGARHGALRDAVPSEVRVVDLGCSRMISALPKLRGYLREQRPDAVLSAITHANAVATMACRTAAPRIPLVVTHHNTLSQVVSNSTVQRDRWSPLVIRLTYPRADRVVAVSQGVAADLSRRAKIAVDRIDVLYNPIDFGRLLKMADVPTGHPWLDDKTQPVSVAIGRLHPQKDFATLLQAHQRLSDEHRLVILGDGPQRESLEKLATELGIAHRVAFAGFVRNPYPYLRTADVLVMSSRWEGLPTVLIEALPFELQIVSTDCPSGPREILDDGRWGTLVPICDPDALADAVSQVLRNPRPRLAQAWKRYDLRVATHAYADLLTDVIGSSSSAGLEASHVKAEVEERSV